MTFLLSFLMYSRNLSVLDFVRCFFVSCAQISEAYAVRTLMKFGCGWRKISHKSKCRKTPRVHSKQVLYPTCPSPVHHKRRQSKAGSQCRHQKQIRKRSAQQSCRAYAGRRNKERRCRHTDITQKNTFLLLHNDECIIKQIHIRIERAA